jgi:hypothetical protein
MDRFAWARRTAALDAERDCHEIYRILVAHEFPWDLNQALSFALFRTYAVPSIGRLLHETGEFGARTQKRYEDTTLLLDAVLEHGPSSATGRTAIRRINQMHGAYDISDDDMRYVLSTFVVSPIRWLDAYGWRRLTEHEKTASAHYYREVGRLMGIKDIPLTWQDFAALHDAHEAEHFAYDAGGRAVADATLDLLATFPPNSLLPAQVVRTASFALMDDALLAAFGYPKPPTPVRLAVRAGLRARAQVVRCMRPRVKPTFARDLPTITGYPDGYDVAQLGTFPRGCPVPHRAEGAQLLS